MRTHVAALARLLWSLLLTAAVLAGTAAGLIWWARWPLPDHWPSTAEWIAFAEQPLTWPVGKAALALAGWLLWLVLVASVLLEAWARLSRRKVRLPRPMRFLAAGMLGTGMLTAATAAHATSPVPAVGQMGDADTHAGSATKQHAAETVDSTEQSAHAQRSTHAPHGVHVPGGWIVWPVAAGVLAAAALALLHSSGYAPATALLRAIRAARQPAIDPSTEEQPQTPGAPNDDIQALARDAMAAAPLTLGLTGTVGIELHNVPRHGLGLTGPGSNDALRGILAAVATGTAATAVIARDLLHRLTDTDLPHLTLTADTPTAWHTIALEVHRRALAENKEQHMQHEPLILVTEPPADPRRLNALAELGSDLNIRIIVAGQWPAGDTWLVDQHGYATYRQTPIGRLNTLTAASLTQLAETLRSATAGPASIPPTVPLPPTLASSPTFRLTILGRPALATPTEPEAHIGRGGARQIAVYLALHPAGVARAELLEVIFGQMKHTTATATLNSCLYQLRQLLTTTHDRSALLRADNRYQLDPDLISVDWWHLLYHLHRGDLHHATRAYTGPIADGYDWDWLPEYRHTTRRLVADAHARLATAAPSPDRALQHALAGITIDPYSPPCYHAAIDAHLHLGNIDEAQILRCELTQRTSSPGPTLGPPT